MFNEAVQLSFTANMYEGLTGRGKKLETDTSARHRLEADIADRMAL